MKKKNKWRKKEERSGVEWKEYPGEKNPDLLRMWEEKMKKMDQRADEVWSKRINGRQMSMRKEWEWARKWGGKEDPPFFLFCGEEFNYELTKERSGFKVNWQIVEDKNCHSDVIDFGRHGNTGPDFVQKRIREIWDYWEQGNTRGRGGFVSNYPIILLKNIDKITNSELWKELLLILDPQKNTKYAKYQIKGLKGEPLGEDDIDLSRFFLVITTSTSDPQVSSELRAKLKTVEPFLEKYKWTIFFSSLGVEIIVFFLIRRIWKRKKIRWKN